MVRSLVRALFLLCLVCGWTGACLAQRQPRGQAGQFDFYVLSLSWAPSFCAAAEHREGGRSPPADECGTHPYAFIVHGLWPQYENGFPQYCQVPAPQLERSIISSVLDLMPSPRLVYAEWDRHGTCSGLSARGYFDTVREARAAVKIPALYLDLRQPLTVTPAAVETAFIDANPGLATADMAVACNGELLTEVRLCLSRDLKFRGCPQIVARSCPRGDALMPPLRASSPGGR